MMFRVKSAYLIALTFPFLLSFIVYLLPEPSKVDICAPIPPKVDLVLLAGIDDGESKLKESIKQMAAFRYGGIYSDIDTLSFEWLLSRLVLNYESIDYVLVNLVNVVAKGKTYPTCAVVRKSVVANFGQEIDSHSAVIRIGYPAISDRSVGRKTTLSVMNSRTLLIGNHIVRHPKDFGYEAEAAILVYICDLKYLMYLSYVIKGGLRNPVVLTDPLFDLLSTKIAKYYSLKRWYERNGNLDNWKSNYQDFGPSSGLQAVLLAGGICANISLYGFNDLSMYEWDAVVHDYDYQGEMNFYKDLANSSTDIPFLSAFDKANFPPVLIRS